MPSKPVPKKERDPLVEEAACRHAADIVAVYRAVQAERGYVTPAAVATAADVFKIPPAQAFGVVSFYSLLSTRPTVRKIIRVCDGPACRRKGGAAARAVVEAAAGSEWGVGRSSCLGLCDCAPAALIGDRPCGPLASAQVGDILGGGRVEFPSYARLLAGEQRVTMARIGKIDPDSIESALGAGAYQALGQALSGPPSEVIDIVDQAGVRGRGGAGFPLGTKWRMVSRAGSISKYVVCNFDESEPGTFKDRVIVDGDPHLLLEGMALCGYAVGSHEGYIYIRGEYEWIARRLESAISQAEERGWLGDRIQGSGFSFRVRVHRGAGAYICGEETALLESLESRRGEPRVRPPYPTARGYLGQPTVVNNVESFCTVPPVIQRGAAWYKSMGTVNSPGVKVFTVFGDVERPCAFEVPSGITLRRIIDQFGGGMKQGSRFKMGLTGGAAGTFVPAALLDVPIDGASARQGISLGSGAMFIMDDTVSAVEILQWLLQFFESESCGKCTPCREGVREARLIVERLASRQGGAGDVGALRKLVAVLADASFCGLGQSVALPIESALRHFSAEFTSLE